MRSQVPTLKGTAALLSYVQRFLYFVSSSINVSIFHITWLDSFWTDLVHVAHIIGVKRRAIILSHGGSKKTWETLENSI